MKIIAIGDPHIKSDNITEYSLFEDRLHHLIDKEQPNFVVILGDVLHHHEKLYTPSLNRAIDFIRKIGEKFKTFVLVGNHDMINNQQFLSDNHWMNSIKLWNKNIIVVDKVVNYVEEGYKFIFCPYVYPGRFKEALDTIGIWNDANIIFAHQEFKGCKLGAIISECGDEWDENLPMVISGHIHLNQWIGKNIYYTGSALQHAFGESERNIIAVIDIGVKNTSRENIRENIREIDLDLPRKKIVSVDIDNIEKLKIPVEKKDQIKVSIKGDITEFKSFKSTDQYKKLVESGIKVVFKQKEIERKDVDVEDNDFEKILRAYILAEKNSELYKLYEKIVNNRDMDEIIII
jgi:DNA repair exonuclease SbcCD nuclease subunit